MITKINRKLVRQRIKNRSRDKIQGTKDCPRLSVYRSLKHVSVQAVTDEGAKVLAQASTYEKEMRKALNEKTGNKQASEAVGKALGERLKAKGIKKVVFDRNGFKYHGVVKSLADAVRSTGIEF